MHSKTNQKIEHALYVVATPIGNLSDISLRALDILNGVNVVAAEDTRNTRHLLQHHGIGDAKLLAVHQHNERGSADKVISLLQEGQSIALVTDAGTPAVSDPGAVLVEAVITAGFRVIPIPGASAVVTALSASGLVNPHFMFYGFLPNKPAARRTALQALANQTCTLAFYEAPHRILECTADLQTVFGDEREIVFAREITKLFESIHRCKLGVALDWLNSDANNQRGEFVLLVSGAPERTGELDAEAERVLTLLLAELPLKQAVQLAVQISGQNKKALYQRALELKGA
ncbi:MAG: 16S rRNA (cytidine(1402)-2'-O)-methyltransferase [Pseudomonadota bacterium]